MEKLDFGIYISYIVVLLIAKIFYYTKCEPVATLHKNIANEKSLI